MERKNILIVNYSPLFPKVMASLDRVTNMAVRLSEDHTVTVVTSFKNKVQKQLSEDFFKKYDIKFIGVPAVNSDDKKLNKLYWRIKYLLAHYIYRVTSDYFYPGNNNFNKHVVRLIQKEKFDIIQIQYWFNWKILSSLKNEHVYKVIDTQDILYEKRKQQFANNGGGKLTFFEKLLVSKYKKLETNAYNFADNLIAITPYDLEVLKRINPACNHNIIATGQEIVHFSSFYLQPKNNTILFYGSMGGKENIDAFFRFYNHIYPLIKKEIKDINVIVLGANPPESIKKLHNNDDFIVTGFVDDVRKYIASANLMILPLDVAAGFRSRTVEVLAMGVPVIGTHKALDNVGMENGKYGFVTDSDEEIARHAINLLKDKAKLEQMKKDCKMFAERKYSIENTYGKLSGHYKHL